MNTTSVFHIGKQTEKNRSTVLNRMEAIACGVQARFEETTGYSKKVTEETVNIARALGVSDTEIERWANHRLSRIALDTERLREMKTLLNKVYGDRLYAMTRKLKS